MHLTINITIIWCPVVGNFPELSIYIPKLYPDEPKHYFRMVFRLACSKYCVKKLDTFSLYVHRAVLSWYGLCPLVADVLMHQVCCLNAFGHMIKCCMKPCRRFCLFQVLANDMDLRHFIFVVVFVRHLLLKRST